MAYTPPAINAANFDVAEATYPAANDVRDNVNYGPSTGAEFNGDLVLPAAGDVKNTVQYGADGTEYTGTYVAAGGGIWMPRARQVGV
jgi:hypothetical protein